MNNHFQPTLIRCLLLAFLWCCLPAKVSAQRNITVDLGLLDGIEISPDNIFNYQIINNGSRRIDAVVKGTLKYSHTPLQFSYSYRVKLEIGVNQLSKEKTDNLSWDFSDNALKELFFNYKKLPQGLYQYCVEIDFSALNAEKYTEAPINDCIYYSVNDMFLINLIEPEDDAKIYETNPMLSWIVNHPIARQLNYRLRIAELKRNQNNANAITRNNPVFQQRNLTALNLLYPVSARPLKKFQPYVWTVDAYYKHILLGGAEVWRFTIIEDTIKKEVVTTQSYYEFEKHIGETVLTAPGELKLKYATDDLSDTLSLRLFDKDNKEVKLPDKFVPLKTGDNQLIIKLDQKIDLQHNARYVLEITSKAQKTYYIPFDYLNPLYITDEK